MRRTGIGHEEISIPEAVAMLVGIAFAGAILWHMVAHADLPSVEAHFLELATLFAFCLGLAFNRPAVRLLRAYVESRRRQ